MEMERYGDKEREMDRVGKRWICREKERDREIEMDKDRGRAMG